MSHRGGWVVGGVFGVGIVLVLFVLLAGRLGERRRSCFSVGGTPGKVGLVEIEGPILSPEPIVRQLKHYGKDRSVPALVIRVNSPGGGVAASQEIYSEIRRLRTQGKRVVASLGSVAASGGYYVAVAADTIVSNPGTLTGSIGVIIGLYNFRELMSKLGLDFYVVKSGKFKDVGSPAREMSPEEREMLQGLTDDTFQQFVDVIVECRGLSKEEVLKIADGRVLTGRQARTFGLVDLLGSYEDAIAIAGEMGGLGREPETVKEGRPSWWEAVVNRLESGVFALFSQRISMRYSLQEL